MLVSVLLNNYNYANFIAEAIESVLNQTYENFELIIIDDGSNDNSREIIEKYAKKDNRIKYIFKENGGQASTFNEGIKHCKGQIISFLDSDDKFHYEKLRNVVNAYKKGYEYILNDIKVIGYNNLNMNTFKYGGYNLFLVYYLTYFVGGVTSSISISKKLADKIFPIKNENFFRIRADDVIVFSAGMFSESYYINKQLTFYRIHGSNGYMSKKDSFTKSYKYNRDIHLHRLKKEIMQKLNIDKRFFENIYHLYLEFTTKHIIDINILKLYLKVLFFEINAPFIKKLFITKRILKHYLKNKNNFIPKKNISI